MSKQAIFWILTAVFVVITIVVLIWYINTGATASGLVVMAPCAVALVCSSLAVRARNERK